jgi:hypothetical protein
MRLKRLLVIISLLMLFAMLSYLQPAFSEANSGKRGIESVGIDEWSSENFTLTAGYYPIANNINNPQSRLFVNNEPSNKQIVEFATTQPSYFFVVSVGKERVMKSLIFMTQQMTPEKVIFSYTIMPLSKKSDTYNIISKVHGEITEYRARELTQKMQWASGTSPFPCKADDYHGVPILDKYLVVQPFVAVKAEVTKIVKDQKLYE